MEAPKTLIAMAYSSSYIVSMRRIRFLVIAVLFTLAPAAWSNTLTLLLSDTAGPFAEFANVLNNALAETSWKITVIGPGENAEPNIGRPDLLVTAGSEALRQALRRGSATPIIATLLPRQGYEKIVAEFGKGRGRSTAIYLDQPPARQAVFLRHLLPGLKRVGVLYSSESRATAGLYRHVFGQAGLMLDSEDSDTDNTLLPAVNALLPRVNVLLANPDSTIYKRDNIKAILVTSYRHQRPVVAFSPAFVNAGAFAALYSTPTQIAHQTADLITNLGATLPAPMAPSQFAISINQNVAQALGLHPPDEANIRRAMLAEREPK